MKLREDDLDPKATLDTYYESLRRGIPWSYPTYRNYVQRASSHQLTTKTPERKRQAQVGSYGEILTGEGQSESTKDILGNRPPLDDDQADEHYVPVKIAKDQQAPDEEEQRRHNSTHLPYRAWCPLCVKGRGRDRLHLRMDHRAEQEHDEVPR